MNVEVNEIKINSKGENLKTCIFHYSSPLSFLLPRIDDILFSRNVLLTDYFPALKGNISRDRKHPF